MAKIIKKEIGKPVEIVETNEKYRINCTKKVLGLGTLGTAEFVPLNKDGTFCIGVDEDGLAKDLPVNFLLEMNNPHFPIQKMVGTVIFVRTKRPDAIEIYDYEVVDVTEEDKKLVEQILNDDYQEELEKKFQDYGKGYPVFRFL